MRAARFLLVGVVGAALAVPNASNGADPTRTANDRAENSASAGPPGSSGHTVTLVTGDRLEVVGTGGQARISVVETAPGTSAISIVRDRTAVYAIPNQAIPLLATERVDRRLFDVTGLVQQGYDDANSDALPVLVQYQGAAAARAASPAAAKATQSLPGLDTEAFTVDKDEASRFWADLTTPRARALDDRASKLWLDAKVEASLDRSVAQIGVPAARARGLDGSGVKVAVLDSGIDTSHPDLAGEVVAAQNFTDEPDTDDRVGHGTHVASIVAGSGAASDGRYTGVAPGAELLNGKVLKLAIVGPGIPSGVGQESWILAGMQWAVDQHADIVNMSLGSSSPDGNDPLSRAVDRLTAQTGTLFVVAAGNSGPDHYTLDSPGTADLALTVGSVDRDGWVSSFSSRGPRLIDGAVKPDVVAPGQEIVAARAAHGRLGRPVDQYYTTMSGTSMATPHVAGAAAILLQQHPDWSPMQVRAALTSTAAFDPSTTIFDQGGGLIDVDRATRQSVITDSGALSMGYFAANKSSDKPRTRTVTYTNNGDTQVTLALRSELTHQSGDPGADGILSVSPSSLTIPAGGSATATITVDAAGVRPGAYSGRVVATSLDADLSTPVGFYRQGDEVQLSFQARDRNGDPGAAYLILRNPQFPGSFMAISAPVGGTSTIRVPAGDYSYFGYVPTPDVSGRYDGQVTIVADPELEAAQPNRTVTLDASKARPFGVHVPRDVDLNGMTVGLEVRRPELGDYAMQDTLVLARGATYGTIPTVPFSVLPFEKPRRGHGNLDSYWNLVSPRARARVVSPSNYDLPVALMDGSGRIDSRDTYNLVDVGSGTPESYDGRDVTGRLVLVRETDGLSFGDQAETALEHGAAGVLVSSAKPGMFVGKAYVEDLPVLAIGRTAGDRLRKDLARRPVRIELSGTSAATYLYDLAFREHDALGKNLVYRPEHLAQVQVDYHATVDTEDPQRFFGRRFPDRGEICGYCGLNAREGEDFHGARSRTDYVTPGVRWGDYLLQDSWLEWDASRTYPVGRSTTSWGRAPVAPGVPIDAGMVSQRVGDQLQLRLAGYTDGDPSHVLELWNAWFRGSTSLTADGVDLGECESVHVLECDLDIPAGAATYTLNADVPAPTFSKSVQSSKTSWTLESRPDERVLPLLDLDYDLPVSLTNTLRAGTRTSMGLDVRRQPGSSGGPIRDVTVEVSFDDGATWTNVRAQHIQGAHYVARIQQPSVPADGTYGSLRVTATDAAGNAIKQEVQRVYELVG